MDVDGASLESIRYRLTALEKDFDKFKEQLQSYDTIRENDLKMQRVNDTASRIETEVHVVSDRLEEMNTRMLLKEGESKERDIQGSAAQANLQIKVLVSILSTVIVIVSGLLVFYLTHK
jgi:hypothetical protein